VEEARIGAERGEEGGEIDEVLSDSTSPSTIIPGQQANFTYHTQSPSESIKYLLFTPLAYNASNFDQTPLVIFLHGASARGNKLEVVRANSLPKMLHDIHCGQVSSYLEIPFNECMFLSPLCPVGKEWKDANICSLLIKLINKVVDIYFLNRNRIYLTGISMGGYNEFYFYFQ
jgi:predicted peptidase